MNLREMIVLTASYYGKSISEPLLEMYVGDLSELSEPEAIDAYSKYRKNPRNRTFPLPSQILEIARPKADSLNLALEASSRVIEAVSRFGYMRGLEAREWIGELGWSAVKRFGGWSYICENLGATVNQQTLFAQIRDLSVSTQRLAELGLYNQPIGISGSSALQLNDSYQDPDAKLNDKKREQILALIENMNNKIET